jgi:hypothetical protein
MTAALAPNIVWCGGPNPDDEGWLRRFERWADRVALRVQHWFDRRES